VLLVGQRHAMNAALLVDQVLGLRDVSELTARALEPGAPSWIKAAYSGRDDASWQELDVPALLQASHFLDVAA
jgi:hypothetical protein